MRTPHLLDESGDASFDLDDAREALAYWEDRVRRLPRHAVRRRREAVVMAERWRGRVAEAERVHYGRGLRGAMLLWMAEGRLPESARHTGRVVARRSRQAALVVLGVIIAVVLAGVVAAVGLLAALIDALG
jgi:hypothetical protein